MSKPNTVAVIGAGIVGIMTAYSLTKRGMKVLIVDAADKPAAGTSHANAGIIAVGHAKAWAGPGVTQQILQALRGKSASVAVTKHFDPALWGWGVKFLGHANGPAEKRNTQKLQVLSRESRARLPALAKEIGEAESIRFDGGLYLFQDQKQFSSYVAALSDADRDTMEVLDRTDLLGIDPALAGMGNNLVGGLRSSLDASGDCRFFAERLLEYASSQLGVETMFGHQVVKFAFDGGRLCGIVTNKTKVTCSHAVIAAGVQSTDLLRPLGIRAHIYPVKGYSGTWRIQDPKKIPHIPYVDETELLAIATYRGKLRATYMAEFARRDRSISEARRSYLQDYVSRNFGAGLDLTSGEFWSGLRPSTPDGPPYLGKIKNRPGLWVNAGHGQLGWTMSVACAERLAACVTGEAINLADVSAEANWLG